MSSFNWPHMHINLIKLSFVPQEHGWKLIYVSLTFVLRRPLVTSAFPCPQNILCKAVKQRFNDAQNFKSCPFVVAVGV